MGVAELAGNNEEAPPTSHTRSSGKSPVACEVPLSERGSLRAKHVPRLCLQNENAPGVLISQVAVKPGEEIAKISDPGGT